AEPLRNRERGAESPRLIAADHFQEKSRQRVKRQQQREHFAIAPPEGKEEPKHQRQEAGVNSRVKLRRMDRHAPRRSLGGKPAQNTTVGRFNLIRSAASSQSFTSLVLRFDFGPIDADELIAWLQTRITGWTMRGDIVH